MARLIVLASSIALLATTAAAGTALGGTTVAATPSCDSARATIVGTARGDLIRGTDGRDVIVARGGADRVVGKGGTDVVCAGTGDDTVLGGDGRDRVLGESGNDILKGEAGLDILDGGEGLDGCYPGDGGATITDCEEADLEVTIAAPASVVDDTPFSYTVRIRNVGGKPTGGFDMRVEQVLTDVVCGYAPASPRTYGTLKPGASVQTVVSHTLGCSIQESASGWHMDIEAEADAEASDANGANDVATARIDFTPAAP